MSRQGLESSLRQKLSEIAALDIHVRTLRREIYDIERLASDNEAIVTEFRKLLKEAVVLPVIQLLEFGGLRRTMIDIKRDMISSRNDLATKRSELVAAQQRLDTLKETMAKIEAELNSAGNVVSWKTPK